MKVDLQFLRGNTAVISEGQIRGGAGVAGLAQHAQVLAAILQVERDLPADPTAALCALAKTAANAVGAERVEARLLRGDDLVLIAASYIHSGPIFGEGDLLVAQSLCGQLIGSGQPVLLSGLQSVPQLAAFADVRDGVQSFIGVPIVDRPAGTPAGTWSAYSARGEAFTQDHFEAWKALAWAVGWELSILKSSRGEGPTEGWRKDVRRVGHSINNQLMAITVGLDLLKENPAVRAVEAKMLDDLIGAAETIAVLVTQLRAAALDGA